jgi:hypothetical protein
MKTSFRPSFSPPVAAQTRLGTNDSSSVGGSFASYLASLDWFQQSVGITPVVTEEHPDGPRYGNVVLSLGRMNVREALDIIHAFNDGHSQELFASRDPSQPGGGELAFLAAATGAKPADDGTVELEILVTYVPRADLPQG